MKKHFGLMFGALAIALVSASSFAQTPTIAVTAPRVTVSTPAVAPRIVAPPTVASPQIVPPTALAPAAVASTLPPSLPAIPAEMPAGLPVAPALAPQAVPPTPAAPPAPPAPAPAVAPAVPAAPPAPAAIAPAAPGPQKPPAPPATPKPAAAPKPPEPPLAIEPPGRERIDPDPVNIRFEVTITNQTGTSAPTKRMAVLTVANNTGNAPIFDRASLRSGNNVPVPTTTFGKETPAAQPVTSYSYRSVGMNVDVRNAALVPGNRVRATLNVEFSGIDEKAQIPTAAPSFPTFSQSMALYFENGKPVLVAQSSDVIDNVERKQTVEVKATILR